MKRDELEKVLASMTLEEKIGQMMQIVPWDGDGDKEVTGPMELLGLSEEQMFCCGSFLGTADPEEIERIRKAYKEKSGSKIPLLFMFDVIHGFRTIFPIPLALGCTFRPEAAREMAEIAGKEASVSGLNVTFSPMADMVRDPRWGRVMESTGEDGWLNGLFAAAMVKGYQENPEEKYRISACVKHFAAYGAVEGGREYNTVDVSDWMLREYYLPAYQAALDAGCDMVMTSFNTVNGIPATGNEYLMRQILREEWGFDGVVISDWGAVGELITHGVAEEGRDAALLAGRAGVDIEMMTPHYVSYFAGLVKEGKISEAVIDDAVRRILELKQKRGLFEESGRVPDPEEAKRICLCEEHRAKARELAEESMVLLKNNGVLPLSDKKKVALVGPLGKEKAILGAWRAMGKSEDAVSLYEGLAGEMPSEQILFAKGCEIRGNTQGDIRNKIDSHAEAEVRRVMSQADVILLALGEEQDMSGEAASRSRLCLPGAQKRLIDMACETGKPTAVVLFSGRPLVVEDWLDETDALLQAWFPGTEGGAAAARILLGRREPSGRLTMSFPRNEGQIPVYYNCFSTGRPRPEGELVPYVSSYLDIPNEPLFPFGYGLTYTEFAYSGLSSDRDTFSSGETCRISVQVRNSGSRAGDEVVQMYVQDMKGCVVRPLRELKGFRKIHLAPGEVKKISFSLSEDMLRFHDTYGRLITQSGTYRVYVGKDSTAQEYVEIEYKSGLLC